MQTTVAELERQLASGRAQVANTEKEREEVTRPPGDISLYESTMTPFHHHISWKAL